MGWGKNNFRTDYRKVKKITHAGYSFGSKLEAALFDMLKLMEMAGEIKDIKPQDHVKMTLAKILYIADFRVTDTKTGEYRWYEAKGYATDVWRIKRRLWAAGYGPGPLRVYGGSHSRLILMEEIVPEELSALPKI